MLRAVIRSGSDPKRDGVDARGHRAGNQATVWSALSRLQHEQAAAQVGLLATEGPPGASQERPKAQTAWLKKELGAALAAATQAQQPSKPIMLVSQDEGEGGPEGRIYHLWWLRGLCPPGLVDQGCSCAYLFAAAEPASGQTICLILPGVSTEAMKVFLRQFSSA